MSTLLPPPAAPDLDTIYSVEAQIDPHLARALHDAGVYDVLKEHEDREAKTPRIDTAAHLGAAVAWSKIPAGATDRREALTSAWAVTFIFQIVTDRKDPKQAGLNALLRGKVRRLGSTFFSELTRRLPYHRLEKMVETLTRPNLYAEHAQTEDIAEIHFTGVVAVRDSAWPAGT